MSKKIYLGVVGQIACGKGVLVDHLKEKLGFISFSLSSILHDDLKKRGITEFNRKTLQDMGDELRRRFGSAALAKRAIKILSKQKTDRIIIEGIRNPGEIEYLKKMPNFFLIGVKAKRDLRFQRLLKRGKAWDPQTYADFLTVDRRDLGVGQEKVGQQVGRCLKYCDFILTNNKDINDFQRKISLLLTKIDRFI